MLSEYRQLYSSEEKVVIWMNEAIKEDRQKMFLYDITSNDNNYELAKKYKTDIHFITFCRKFSDTLSHHIIEKVIKQEIQKQEPVKLWYCRVA